MTSAFGVRVDLHVMLDLLADVNSSALGNPHVITGHLFPVRLTFSLGGSETSDAY